VSAKGEGALVGLFPGASLASKRWPLERFAELAARLETGGARIVVFLGPEESAVAARARALFSSSALVLDGLTLSQLASASALLDLLVSNDSGPMHLAAAVGTPVLLLLGAPVRGAYWFGPVGERHRVLVRRTLSDISVAEAHAAASSMLTAADFSRRRAFGHAS